MRRVIALVMLLGMILSNIIPILAIQREEKFIEIECKNIVSENESRTVKVIEENQIESTIEKAQSEMTEILDIKNSKEWYLEYMKIVEKYSDVIDPPETVYDYYTDEEIYYIQRTVETECYDQDFDSKCNVASVIFNRVILAGEFGESVEEVITSKNQFCYWRTDISEDSVLAVEYAFSIRDTTDGCIAFRSDKKVDTWYGWDWVFTDDIGHHFYK